MIILDADFNKIIELLEIRKNKAYRNKYPRKYRENDSIL